SCSRESGVLQDDALDDIGDVFALINGGFDDLENLLPLDDLNRVLFLFKELSDESPANAIAFVFEAVDFDDAVERLVRRLHGVDGRGEFDSGRAEDLGKLDGAGADGVDAVKNEAAGGGVDEVNDVVHGAAKLVHVLAVERSDKGLVELAEDLVGDFVALMLDGLDALDLLGDAGVMLQHLSEGLGAGDDVFCLLLKEDEKIPVARHEALQKSRHVTRSPLRSRVWHKESTQEGEARQGNGSQGRGECPDSCTPQGPAAMASAVPTIWAKRRSKHLTRTRREYSRMDLLEQVGTALGSFRCAQPLLDDGRLVRVDLLEADSHADVGFRVHDAGSDIHGLAIMRDTHMKRSAIEEGIHHVQIASVAAKFAGARVHGGLR